tara:strand:- start:5594 stop:6223 length:630 start_codon:yes stop_codon:yes gene_type:complete
MPQKVMSKKQLEILLTKVEGFRNPKIKFEQYFTDATIVADMLWNARHNRHVKGKIIADLGCGPGIFGFGALILGAKKVYFVDLDKEALQVAKDNQKVVEKILGKKLNCSYHNINVKDFDENVQVVIQNPPFGVKRTHHDKLFLVKAMEMANVVYSFHKLSTKKFVEKFVGDNGFRIKELYTYDFPIKKQFFFHISRVKNIEVGCWVVVK